MAYSERTDTLEAEDLRKPMFIAKMQRNAFIGILIFSPIIYTFALRDRSVFLLIFLIINTIIILTIVNQMVSKYNKKIINDFNNHKKIIINGILEEKFRTGMRKSTMFYYKIGNRILKIHPDLYNQFEEKQSVEIEIAPISQYVISIKKLAVN